MSAGDKRLNQSQSAGELSAALQVTHQGGVSWAMKPAADHLWLQSHRDPSHKMLNNFNFFCFSSSRTVLFIARKQLSLKWNYQPLITSCTSGQQQTNELIFQNTRGLHQKFPLALRLLANYRGNTQFSSSPLCLTQASISWIKFNNDNGSEWRWFPKNVLQMLLTNWTIRSQRR